MPSQAPVSNRRVPRRQSALLWLAASVAALLAAARRDGLLVRDLHGHRLSESGAAQSRSVVRNHRLWETYLILHADIAPSHVDRDADDIEHLLGPDLIRELDAAVADAHPQQLIPPSPHPLPHTHR